MINKFFKYLISTFSALFWICLINLPQESKPIFLLWDCIYFFPFFFISLIVFLTILNIESLKNIRSFFYKKIYLLYNVLILTILFFISYKYFLDKITLFSFVTNIASFSFSIFFYYRIERSGNKFG